MAGEIAFNHTTGAPIFDPATGRPAKSCAPTDSCTAVGCDDAGVELHTSAVVTISSGCASETGCDLATGTYTFGRKQIRFASTCSFEFGGPSGYKLVVTIGGGNAWGEIELSGTDRFGDASGHGAKLVTGLVECNSETHRLSGSFDLDGIGYGVKPYSPYSECGNCTAHVTLS